MQEVRRLRRWTTTSSVSVPVLTTLAHGELLMINVTLLLVETTNSVKLNKPFKPLNLFCASEPETPESKQLDG